MPDARPMASPVFVDPTGRRRRTVRLAAVIGAGTLFAVGALLVAALLGVPIAPTASLPEPAPAAPPVKPQPGPGAERGDPASTSQTPGRRARDDRPADATPVTTTPTPTTTTPTSAKGKPEAPPGRPTDLPTPPGHTR
ncbi:MAG TPA: hypothetical protein VGX25_27390 [Actinophytocola sp.]|uniref:hypothetical protein n=1 Tax=Actinophytocola sp. TaxID=1872138 RepID=UPI002DDD9018|nr:hypothetical protein [Actinophytocola sp.]HEV2783123.1 hypothetical protein [Actinophytocola sp.]